MRAGAAWRRGRGTAGGQGSGGFSTTGGGRALQRRGLPACWGAGVRSIAGRAGTAPRDAPLPPPTARRALWGAAFSPGAHTRSFAKVCAWALGTTLLAQRLSHATCVTVPAGAPGVTGYAGTEWCDITVHRCRDVVIRSGVA